MSVTKNKTKIKYKNPKQNPRTKSRVVRGFCPTPGVFVRRFCPLPMADVLRSVLKNFTRPRLKLTLRGVSNCSLCFMCTFSLWGIFSFRRRPYLWHRPLSCLAGDYLQWLAIIDSGEVETGRDKGRGCRMYNVLCVWVSTARGLFLRNWVNWWPTKAQASAAVE